jgi:hypothetical protein
VCGRNEVDSKLSLVTSTSSAQIGSDPNQELNQGEATREMAVGTNQRGKATSTCSSLEKDVGEEDSKPSLVTSSAQIGSDPDQEVV